MRALFSLGHIARFHKASASLILIITICNAHSATLTVDNKTGLLVGAKGVVVGSDTYTVRFVDGTCAGLFSGCDSASDFGIKTTQSQVEVTGLMAAQALYDQVFLKGTYAGVTGYFDNNSALTYGCGMEGACTTIIPYGVTGTGSRPSNMAYATVTNIDGMGGVYNYGGYFTKADAAALGSTSSYDSINGAIFTKNTTTTLPNLPLLNGISSKPFLIGTVDPKKPTIVITHGWQMESGYSGSYPSWLDDMKKAILAENPNVNVLIWVWPSAYEPNVNTAKSTTTSIGYDLGKELLARGAQDVQFIGHSLGTYVSAVAASELVKAGVTVNQVTLLDRPFPSSVENDFFLKYLVGVGWVDNYYNLLNIGGTIDLKLPGAYNEIVNRTHSGVREYYLETISNNIKDGFYWSLAGGGYNDPLKTPKKYTLEPNVVDMHKVLIDMGTLSNAYNANILGDWAILTEGSPAYLWGDIAIPLDANYFGFEFYWGNVGDGDYLTLFFDDELLFYFLGVNFTGNDFMFSDYIDISRFSGRTGRLTFALNSAGGSNADISIRNISFYLVNEVPEPTSLALLIIGIFGIIGVRKIHCQ